MSISADKNTRVLLGITGSAGALHTDQCLAYGSQFVGGVTPKKGGTTWTGKDRRRSLGVQHRGRSGPEDRGQRHHDLRAAGRRRRRHHGSGRRRRRVIVAITEGIPVLDMARAKRFLKGKPNRLIGPNCPGVITPGQCKIGIMPGYIHKPVEPGKTGVGVISRSGTLTYEAVFQLTSMGYAQSTCVGIGGDPIIGTTQIDLLKMFQDDPGTEAILMIGEIGGTAEERAAEYMAKHVKKPVAAFIAGQTAPPGRRMGHAGAIISGGSGSAEDKIGALQAGRSKSPRPRPTWRRRFRRPSRRRRNNGEIGFGVSVARTVSLIGRASHFHWPDDRFF